MIHLFLVLAVVGLVVWLLITYVPMPPPFRTAIIVIAVIVLILYIMSVFGIADLPVPRLR